MTCGRLPLGGCYIPDLTHDGPCRVTPNETTEQRDRRAARNRARKGRERKTR